MRRPVNPSSPTRPRRRGDDARRDRRRLPRLQRQQGPAVRPDDAAEVPGLQRREPAARQRRARGRLPHRHRRGHAPGAPARRQLGRARSTLKLDKTAGDDPGRLDRQPAAALGARPEVRRARRAAPRARRSPTAARCPPPRRASPSSSTTSTASSTSRRATRPARTSTASATRFAQPRRGAQPHDRRAARASCSHLEPVARTLADPEHPARPLLQRARRRRARRRAGRRPLRALASTPARTRSRPGRATPKALQETIRRSAPTLDAGIRSFRVQRPFLPTSATSRASLRARQRDAAAHAAAHQPGAARPALPCSAALGRDQRASCAARCARSATLMEDPRTGVALRGVTDLTQHPQPAGALRRPLHHGLQLLQLRLDATPASTSPSPTRPAPPSARCSTRRRARATRPHPRRARSARASPSTASP